MKNNKNFELKVFTMPTCSICSVAKQIAYDVAKKLGLSYREVNMGTLEGLEEGIALNITSAPSITLNDEIIVAGRLVSGEKLEEEVRKRLEKWNTYISSV